MSRSIWRCKNDIMVRKSVVDTVYDLEVTARWVVYYAFVKDYSYAGQPANHPETRQEGILFQNHQAEEHFISLPFLEEHFEPSGTLT